MSKQKSDIDLVFEGYAKRCKDLPKRKSSYIMFKMSELFYEVENDIGVHTSSVSTAPAPTLQPTFSSVPNFHNNNNFASTCTFTSPDQLSEPIRENSDDFTTGNLVRSSFDITNY